MKKLVGVFLLFLSASIYGQQSISTPQKYALVIGNGAYTDIVKLPNPENDANDIETVLGRSRSYRYN